MSFDYTRMKATANRLVKKFGKSGKSDVLVKEINESFDPVSGTKTSQESTHSFIGVFMPASNDTIRDLDIRLKDTGLVYKQYKVLIVDGSQLPTVAFETNDKIRVDGKDWNIAGVTIMNPNAGEPIYWTIAIGI